MTDFAIDEAELIHIAQPYFDNPSLISSELMCLIAAYPKQFNQIGLVVRMTNLEFRLQSILRPLHQLIFNESEEYNSIRLLMGTKRKPLRRAGFPGIGNEMTAVLHYGTGAKTLEVGMLNLGLRSTDIAIEIALERNAMGVNHFFGSLEQLGQLVHDFIEAIQRGVKAQDHSDMCVQLNPFAPIKEVSEGVTGVRWLAQWKTPIPAVDVPIPDFKALVEDSLEDLRSYRDNLKSDQGAATAVKAEFVRIAEALFRLNVSQQLDERTLFYDTPIKHRGDLLSELVSEHQIIEGMKIYLENSALFPGTGGHVERFIAAVLGKLYRAIFLGCTTLVEYNKVLSQKAPAKKKPLAASWLREEGGQRGTTPDRAVPTRIIRM